MGKIHICGIHGCGKSTLALQLSEIEEAPCYHLDDIKYSVKYSETRPIPERITRLDEICDSDEWITEGTWTNYAEAAFKKCDFVIHMAYPRLICDYRILKRFFTRERAKGDDLTGAIELVKQVHEYYGTTGIVSFAQHQELIQKYNKPYTKISNDRQLRKFLHERERMRA